MAVIFLVPAFAASHDSIRQHIQKKYLNGQNQSLVIDEDEKIPFSNSHLFRVRTDTRGWTVLSDKNGNIVDVNKSGLKPFLHSLETALLKMKFKTKDKSEAVKISHTLMNHLSTARRNVACVPSGEITSCEISFAEGQLAQQKAQLIFDFKNSSIKIK